MRRTGGLLVAAIIALGLGAPAAHADVSISGPSSPVTEGDGSAGLVYTLTRSAVSLLGSTAPVTVTVAVDPSSTASCPGDVSGDCTRQVTVDASALAATTATVTFPVVDDSISEAPETLVAKITDAGAETISPSEGSATGTIDDNDPPPTIAVGAASGTEGTGSTPTTLGIPVTLSTASGQPVSVHYALAAGTADASDVALAAGTVSVPAGQTTAMIPAQVTADDLDENDETFTATISDPTNATLKTGATSATATIVDDDSSTIAVDDVTAAESAGPFGFTVSLSGPSTRTIMVTATTGDGSATAGSDYTAESQTLSFAPGETSKTFSVPVIDDTTAEPDEYFLVGLTSPTNATISRAIGGGTITNDDAPPTMTTPGTPAGAGTTASSGTGSGSGSATGTGTGLGPGTSSGSGGGSGGPDTTAPNAKLGGFSLHKPGTVVLKVSCPSTEQSCSTMVTVFVQANPRSKVAYLRKERKLGQKLVKLTGGRSATVSIKLSSVNAKALKAGKSTKATAYAVTRDAAGNVGTEQLSTNLKA